MPTTNYDYIQLDDQSVTPKEPPTLSRFQRAKKFREEKRKFRRSKAYIYLKLAFVAVILSVFAGISGAKNFFQDQPAAMDADFSRSRRNTESENLPPWEECDFEKSNDGVRAVFIIIWLVLIIWIFVGLAVICDDFFVPSLEMISDQLNLTEDVAGATFMAAGSSAPELFTSIAGVSFESDVGVGTIVGSAIFNLLIIIALSAALSLKTLNIDWRPLARDSVFYAMSIVMFIVFAWDGVLELYECGILFFGYCLYVTTMFVNQPLMRFLSFLESCICSCFKDGKHDATELTGNGELVDNNLPGESNTREEHSEDNEEGIVLIRAMPAVPLSVPKKEGNDFIDKIKFVGAWIIFVAAFPWALAFAWTVPNCSKDHLKKWFMVSFLMSVLWIAICSFGLVFMVGRAGCAMTIDSFVMGLILVAIGTSVPDALSSIIVAREGFGDMAVSNAIGSNVFDINLGIGLPSVIRIIADTGAPIFLVEAEEKHAKQDKYPNNPFIPHVKFGFLLLFVLIVCLAIFGLVKFRLNRVVGISFAVMYLAFIAYAMIQEFACDGGYGC